MEHVRNCLALDNIGGALGRLWTIWMYTSCMKLLITTFSNTLLVCVDGEATDVLRIHGCKWVKN